MKRLMTVVVLFAGLWAGYWWFGITQLRSAVTQGLAQIPDRVTLGDWSAQGFPSRFDIDIREAQLRGPNWQWDVPQAEIMAMAWAPTRLIVWAGVPQTLSVYGQTFEINAQDMRANVDFAARGSLPLEKVIAVMEAPQVSGLVADQARLALQSIPDGADETTQASARYRIGGALTNVRSDSLTSDAVTPANVAWDAQIALPAPIDRVMLQSGVLPRAQSIDLTKLTIDWAGASVAASGQLTVLPSGYLDGPVDLELQNIDQVIALLRESNIMPASQIDLIDRALRAIGRGDGSVSVPLRFAGGQTMLAGLFRIGPAPRLP
jgi:hypothetical protein